MGQLITGDPRHEPTYTISEISLATGVNKSTLQNRRRRLGIKPDGRYDYQQVKLLLRKPGNPMSPRMKSVNELKAKLKDDGYT